MFKMVELSSDDKNLVWGGEETFNRFVYKYSLNSQLTAYSLIDGFYYVESFTQRWLHLVELLVCLGFSYVIMWHACMFKSSIILTV